MNAQEADPRIAQRALEILRALCRGNGVKSDSIRLGQANIQMLGFDAITKLEVRPQVENKKSGKIKGQVEQMGSAQDVQAAIDGILQGFAHDSAAQNVVVQTILSRKDKGFFLQKKDIPIDALERVFSYAESCATCNGQGRSTCQRCHGRTREACTKCHARGTMPCVQCRGSGEMPGPDGQRIQCNRCFGKRVMPCDLCRQTGEISCRQCRATGQIPCPTCKGSGGQQHMTVVRMVATTNFGYQRDGIPPDVILLLEEKGPELVTAGHLKLKAAKADSRTEPMAIDYYVEYPFGDIGFTIRDKPLRAKLFGFKSKLLELPNFLDQLIAPGIAQLEQAASGHGSITNLVRKAARYRVIGYGLMTTNRQSVRKSAATLKQKFPIGLGSETINRIVPLSKRAIGNLTRKPLYAGFAIGSLVTAGLFAAYFLGPIRSQIMSSVANANLHPVIDVAFLVLGGFITTFIAQQIAGRAVKKALGHLVPAKKRSQLIPKSGGSHWWGYVGAILLFAVFLEISLQISGNTPVWYANIR